MCTTLFLIRRHKFFKFMLVFNRDEFFNRETIKLKEYQGLVYPLDVISNGTFFCFNKESGNICVLLNNPFQENPYSAEKLKRGSIPIDFCKLPYEETTGFIEEIEGRKEKYNGFNLVYGNFFKEEYFYYSNNTNLGLGTRFEEGIHSVSNWPLETEVSKCSLAKKMAADIEELAEEEAVKKMEEIFQNKERLDEPLEKGSKEHQKSALFVVSEIEDERQEFGTRHTLVLGVTEDNQIKVSERTFDDYCTEDGKLRQNQGSDFYNYTTF